MLELKEYLQRELERLPKIIAQQYSETRKLDIKLGSGYATGAGDSYAASYALFYLSKGAFMPLDPMDLETIEVQQNSQLVAISVKGKTIKVIDATKRLKPREVEIIAITASENSPLGKNADKVVKLVYSGGELMVGVGNYAAIISALGALTGHGITEFHTAYKKAMSTPTIEEADNFVAIGEHEGYVNAMFTCLKLYETSCSPCRYYRLEQFLHAPIYSLPENTTITVFQSSRNTQPHDIVQVLEQAGYQVISVRFGEKPLPNLVGGTAYAARIAAFLAEKHGYTKPCFLTKREILEPSTNMIYK